MMAAKRNKASVLVAAVISSFITSLAGLFFFTFASVVHGQVNHEIGDVHSALSNRRASDEVTPQIIERHQSFADFIYLSNEERDPVRHDPIYFWTPDTLNGWIHSNDTLHFSYGCPNIQGGRITSPEPIYVPPDCELPPGSGYYPAIQFPDSAADLRNYSGYNIGTLGHDSLTQLGLSVDHIYFRKCGKVRINGVDKIRCDPATMGQNYIHIPPSGVIFVNGKVWISAARGRADRMDGAYPESLFYDGNFISQGFSGALTIGSSDTIIIVDDLIYRHAKADNSVPTAMDSCSDILGLVSENWVMIGRHVRDSVYINAGITALRAAFSVQDIYWSLPPDWDNEKVALFVWGSIGQRYHGLIHTQVPYGHSRGFIAKHYNYDVRFTRNRPPYFPEARFADQYRVRYMQD
jgi:hypothetical protein